MSAHAALTAQEGKQDKFTRFGGYEHLNSVSEAGITTSFLSPKLSHREDMNSRINTFTRYEDITEITYRAIKGRSHDNDILNIPYFIHSLIRKV